MKRTAILKRSTPLKSSGILKRSGKAKEQAKPKRMKSGKVPPNAAERAWMDFVASFGCVVCWREHGVKTPCAVHHIIEGGRRKGHMFTIGLCDPGHHQNSPTDMKISRHPWRARFEAAYGTEEELHQYMLEQWKKGEAQGMAVPSASYTTT